MTTVKVKVNKTNPNATLPSYATAGAAGMDVCACLPAYAPKVFRPGERGLVPTGLAFALPHGYEMQIRPRSGLALKSGISVINSPGTLDQDYRGELGILLINHSQDESVTIRHGDRIAQLIVQAIPRVELEDVVSLDETDRGAGGFGSTG